MDPLKALCRRILRADQSNRQIAQAAGRSATTVGRYRQRLVQHGLTWPDVEALDAEALDRLLNPDRRNSKKLFVEPDWSEVYAESQRRGVTLRLLHEEYAEGLESGVMSETEFLRRFHRHARTRGLVMRQIHHPGKALYLDFSGKRPAITDHRTGVKRPVELFVAVMGASRKTFALAVESQKLPDWIHCNVEALAFFGGVSASLIPDNLKAAVTARPKGEAAVINMTYNEFAAHYDTDIVPTRPRKPKDKAHVEVGVQIAQRWILARLRNRIFFSIEEINVAIRGLLDKLNDRPMRSVGGKSRNQLFDELDAPALKPLPPEPYKYADWKLAVPIGRDYHVSWDGRFYSVPHTLVGAKVNLKVTRDTVMVFHRDKRVATHAKVAEVGGYSTLPEHQPAAHRAYSQDNTATLLSWAQQQGGALHAFVRQHIEHNRNPTASLQAMRGLQQMSRESGVERLQVACERALAIHARSVSSVRSILNRGLDRQPADEAPGAANDDTPQAHENIRGPHYYN